MKEIVITDRVPKAIGPYSQAVKVKCGTLLFCSGQIPLDPATQELVGKTAAEQCRQVMTNIGNLLNAAGSEMSQIVKTTIFLADMNDFSEVNAVYAEYFQVDPPARATVEVSRLPKDVLIEIDVIAAM